MFKTFGKTLSSLVKNQLNDFGCVSVKDICCIDGTMEGDNYGSNNSFVNKDGSLSTYLEINGTYKIVDENNFEEIKDHFFNNLKGILSKKGLTLSISFNKDPSMSMDKIKELYQLSRNKEKYGFNVSPLLNQSSEVLSNATSYEKSYLVITTDSQVLNKNIAKKSVKNARDIFSKHMKEYAPGKQAQYSQVTKILINDIIKIHSSDVKTIMNILSKYLSIRELTPNEAVKEMRTFFYPELTKTGFKAKIFKDSAGTSVVDDQRDMVVKKNKDLIISSDKKGEDNDVSNLLYPSIFEQIILSDGEIDNFECKRLGVKGIAQIGQRYYAPIFISSPPEEATRFDSLFNSIDIQIPFRMLMSCSTDSEKFIKKLNNIKLFSTMLTITNKTRNQPIKDAASDLVKIYSNEKSDTPIETSTIFLTWGNSPEEVIRNRDSLISSIQVWGSTDAISDYGDPYTSSLQTIPGFSRKRSAQNFIMRLSEVVTLLPFTRSSSPWEEGTNFLCYTKDKKIWGYSSGTEIQHTWGELISAQPGSGKSLIMNAMSVMMVCNMPNDELPKIGIIDVGRSSEAMVDFVREILPDHLKDQAKSYRMKMTDEYTVNPFDTLLGCRYPVSNDRSFIQNLLITLLLPIGVDSIQELPELVNTLIDEAYKYYDPRINPSLAKKYEKGTIIELDNFLEKNDLGFGKRKNMPLFEVEDELFKAGYIDIAKKVHLHAMPLITDLPMVLSQSSLINDLYGRKGDQLRRQDLIDTCVRQLNAVIQDYPVLRNPSVFDISSTSIVSLDLGDVVSNSSNSSDAEKRRTAVIYLLARNMLGKNYFRDSETVKEKVIPELYKEYHRSWISIEETRLKRLCIDELHKTDGNESLKKQIESDIRIGRKYKLIVTLASQKDTDFTNIMTSQASTKVVMGSYDNNTAKELGKKYEFDKDTLNYLKNRLGPPNENGSSMLVFGSTKKGDFSQVVYFKAPPILLWGLTSTAEDRLFRQYVSIREGGNLMLALDKLSRVFRKGSIVSVINDYKNQKYGEITVEKGSSFNQTVFKILYDNNLRDLKI